MQEVTIGSILEGKVTGITKFGAFVEIGEGATGMVHISEVASNYVNEIRDHLTENQQVKVKVLSVSEDGKISLSIKKAQPREFNENNRYSSNRQQGNRSSDGYRDNRQGGGKSGGYNKPRSNSRPYNPNPAPLDYSSIPEYVSPKNRGDDQSFEDMMSKFKQSSDDKMTDLKKYIDVKRGSSNRRSQPR